MKHLRIIILLIITPIYLNAQNIRDICKIHIERLGGIDAINKIENISVEQVLYSNNREIPQTTIIIPYKLFYQEVSIQFKKNIICVIDGKGWFVNSYLSEMSKDLSEKDANIYMSNSNIFGPLYDYYSDNGKSMVKNITLEGEEKVGKSTCYKLKVIYKSDFVVYVYVSQKDYMILKSKNNFGTIVYSDYKKVNKVMFPFSIEITNAGGVMTGDVINLKTNIKIDYDMFNKK